MPYIRTGGPSEPFSSRGKKLIQQALIVVVVKFPTFLSGAVEVEATNCVGHVGLLGDSLPCWPPLVVFHNRSNVAKEEVQRMIPAVASVHSVLRRLIVHEEDHVGDDEPSEG